MALIPISLDDMSSVLDLILTCCGQGNVGMALIHISLDNMSSVLDLILTCYGQVNVGMAQILSAWTICRLCLT